jgi:hypothetical protein
VSLAAHSLANPVQHTGIVVADDPALLNDIDWIWEDWGDFNETEFNELELASTNATDEKDLQARQDNEWVACYQGTAVSAYKAGFRTFMDYIPNTVIDMRTTRMPYAYVARIRNVIAQCEITSRGGTIASGGNVRRMGHRGYRECVNTGRNDDFFDDERFYNFGVYNPGYYVRCGSGPPTCRAGINGGTCQMLPDPP